MSKLFRLIWVTAGLCGVMACGDSGATDNGSSTCGNGALDVGEQCEASPTLILNGESCASATVGMSPNGVLGCNVNCTFNVMCCVSGATPAPVGCPVAPTGGAGGFGGTSGVGGAGGTGGVGGVGGTGGVGGVGGMSGSGGVGGS